MPVKCIRLLVKCQAWFRFLSAKLKDYVVSTLFNDCNAMYFTLAYRRCLTLSQRMVILLFCFLLLRSIFVILDFLGTSCGSVEKVCPNGRRDTQDLCSRRAEQAVVLATQ